MYRLVDCGTWDDPWFAELAPNAKLFFLYLVTNRRSTSCGAFEITERAMAFETGLDVADIRRWLGEWAPRVQWWPEHTIVWLKNFYRHNNHNPKMALNAQRVVAALPACIQVEIGKAYPELLPIKEGVSIGYAEGMHIRKGKESKEKEEEKAKESKGAREGYLPEFEIFWQRYPRKEPSKKETARSWVKVMAQEEPPSPEQIMAGLERWLPVWAARGDPEKVPHATTWLNQERWTVEFPARASPRNGPWSAPGGKTFSELAKDAEARDESRRNGQGAGSHPRPLLANTQDWRERPGADVGDVDDGAGGHAIDAAYRERP